MEIELKYLIQEIGILKKRYDLIRDQEEKFNIFSVMYKEHDERRLHSRFIAALLNPYGSHEMKDLFLRNFFDVFIELEYSNFQKAIVYPEEWNKKENNNIDILIIDRTTKHAIIIENKIYAGDSNSEIDGQLERYYKHIRDTEKIPEKNIFVFYLTLDGHNPSQESIGSFGSLEKINGQCISYEIHILTWLKKCVADVYNRPFIRESILQYEKLIKKMTSSEINIEERLKMKDLIAQTKESMTSTKYLLDNFKHVKWHTIADFWKELEQEFRSRGFEIIKSIDLNTITHLTHFPNNKKEEDGGIYFKVTEGLDAFVWHEKDDCLYWGFEKKGISETKKLILENLTKEGCIKESNSCWWNYFEFSDSERLWIKNFSEERTFNLINPVLRKETISNIVEVVSNFINNKNIK